MQDASRPGYRVEAPHAGDAVGLALRDAFERDFQLPEEMATLLRQLNRMEYRQAR